MAAAAALLGGPASPPQADAPPQTSDDVGLPVLELFLRPSPNGEGYEQQAAALYAPDAALAQQEGAAGGVEDGAAAVAESIAEMISAGARRPAVERRGRGCWLAHALLVCILVARCMERLLPPPRIHTLSPNPSSPNPCPPSPFLLVLLQRTWAATRL
jgi:hypothetical protein